MAKATRKLPRNFGSYGAIEGFNAFLLPTLALYFAWPREPTEILAFALAIASSSGVLIVGFIYWRGVDRYLRLGERGRLEHALAIADRAERPLLLATGASSIALVVALLDHGWSHPVIAVSVLTALALLEYVNYYHRQLQHFDNIADFKRLLSGSKPKIAHMKRNLEARRRRLSRQTGPEPKSCPPAPAKY